MASQTDIAQEIAGVTLFADLSPAQLEKVSHAFEEQWFEAGERAERQGFVGSGFHVILDGEAELQMGGEVIDRTATSLIGTKPFTLKRGDWFGELSILFGEPAISDVVATRPLHCIVLPAQELEPFLFAYPGVMYRLLLGEARRLRDPLRWQR